MTDEPNTIPGPNLAVPASPPSATRASKLTPGVVMLYATFVSVVATCVLAEIGAFVIVAFPVFFAAAHLQRHGRRPGLVAFLCLTPAFGLSLLASWSVGVLYAMITIPLFVLTLATVLAQGKPTKWNIFLGTILASPLWMGFSAVASLALWVVLAKLFIAIF